MCLLVFLVKKEKLHLDSVSHQVGVCVYLRSNWACTIKVKRNIEYWGTGPHTFWSYAVKSCADLFGTSVQRSLDCRCICV